MNATDKPAIAILGRASCASTTTVAEVEGLPLGVGLVVVECECSEPASALARVRAQVGPAVRMTALLDPARAARATELLEMGYDDIAVGQAHLRRLIDAWRQQLDAAEELTRVTTTHAGLLQLIDEIAKNPSLHQVLQIAVLRMSELFSVERISVVIFDQHRKVGFVVMEREQALLDNVVINIPDYPELEQVIHTKQPLVIADMFGDTLLDGVRSKLNTAQEPPRAALLFPLSRKDQVVGALFLRSKATMAHVDDNLLTMGGLIASVTSVAIGHALEQDMLLSETRALKRTKASLDEQLAGLKELRGVTIDPQATTGDAAGMLEDLIIAAWEEASRLLELRSQEILGKMGLPPGLAGMR